MNWHGSTKNCMRSDLGYLISRYWVVDRYWYIPRTPSHKLLKRTASADDAKAQCEQEEREFQACV